MKSLWAILIVLLFGLSAVLATWLVRGHAPTGSWPVPQAGTEQGGPRTVVAGDATERGPGQTPLRIGLIPERDVFVLRKRYRAVADYLAGKLGRPVQLVTMNSYQAVLGDLESKEVDAAFLGSFVAVLAMDRLGARMLVKPTGGPDGGRYRGEIIVLADSPIRSVDDLLKPGRRLAVVKFTTAGHLFPVWLLAKQRTQDPAARAQDPGDAPRFVWAGTHDQVIDEVQAGRADAGAVKNLRVEAYESAHPNVKFRRLASSDLAPDNTLVVRANLADLLGPQLKDLLLNMASDPAGREALKTFGASGFEPCDCPQFAAIFKMVGALGQQWDQMGVTGPPPWCACVGTPRPQWSRTPSSGPAGPVPSPAGGG